MGWSDDFINFNVNTSPLSIGLEKDLFNRGGSASDPLRPLSEYNPNGQMTYINQPDQTPKTPSSLDLSALKGQYGIGSITDAQNLTSGFNLKNLSNQLLFKNGKKVDQADSAWYASALSKEIGSTLSSQLGREASQAEIASVFNHMDFSKLPNRSLVNGAKGISFEDFMANPQAHIQDVIGTGAIQGHIEALTPKFQQITEANNSLQQFGKSLSQSQISQILGTTPDSAVNPERSQQLTDSFAKALSNEAVQEQTNALPGQQKTAIDEFEKSLMENQSQYYNQYVAPQIAAQTNARYGGYGTGDLASSLASAGAQGAQHIRDMTAPLRSQAALSGVQNSYENALRGALESGRSLQDATSFARQLYTLQNQQNFSAGQAELGRQNQQDMYNQGLAYQLALGSANTGPTGTQRALAGGISGAAGGSAFGPWGTAIGGVTGALGGYFSGK